MHDWHEVTFEWLDELPILFHGLHPLKPTEAIDAALPRRSARFELWETRPKPFSHKV